MAKIIYVEDDEVMGDLVKEILTEAGHLVGVIAHGVLAYETIAFKRPDLVLLDQGVPGMDGVAIVRQLRQLPATYLTPVIMLTGRQEAALADEAMIAGVDDYLTKPFDPADLVARVSAALAEKSFAATRRIR